MSLSRSNEINLLGIAFPHRHGKPAAHDVPEHIVYDNITGEGAMLLQSWNVAMIPRPAQPTRFRSPSLDASDAVKPVYTTSASEIFTSPRSRTRSITVGINFPCMSIRCCPAWDRSRSALRQDPCRKAQQRGSQTLWISRSHPYRKGDLFHHRYIKAPIYIRSPDVKKSKLALDRSTT